MEPGTIVIIVAIAVFLLFLMRMYNRLVNKKNQVENVFGGIDALLKKRYDLIPNLVAAVQTYMKHEQSVLTEITELRARAISGNISPDEKVDLNNKISRVLGGIQVAVENYPDLKANQNFLQLQKAMNEVEEQLSAARRAFNAVVTDYNNAVEMFPSSIFAAMMKLKRRQVFEIHETERQNISVKKLFNE